MTQPAVIIPVYNAYEDLSACLGSLDRHSPDAEVLIVNDASTDPRVGPLLEAWCSVSTRRTLVTQPANMGFVKAANRGAGETGGDFILLNSDTLVTPGWLTALSSCLASDDRIATATPWTNNGEIASFPDLCVAAPVPDNPDFVARIIADSGEPVYPDIPTAVGFCMAVSRQAWKLVGEFDAEHFGHGYGEENDFSMRARKAGWRNVLCDDAFVAHVGGQSFQALNMAPGPRSMERLLSRHPEYDELISRFIRSDPLARRRAQLAGAVQAAAA